MFSERSFLISDRFSSVSLDGPFGPWIFAKSAAVPRAPYSERQRHTVVSFTPKAAATARWLAASAFTSCTAHSRRAAGSLASQVLTTWPHTNTDPLPASSSSSAMPSATGTEPTG